MVPLTIGIRKVQYKFTNRRLFKDFIIINPDEEN